VKAQPSRNLVGLGLAVVVAGVIIGAGIAASYLDTEITVTVTSYPTETATAFSAQASTAYPTETSTAYSTQASTPYSTASETVTIGTPPPCNENVYNTKTVLTMENVPVLLMQPGSTASICVTYQSAWQGNSSEYNKLGFGNGTYGFSLSIGKERCETSAGETSCTEIVSNSFIITANPGSIQPSPTTNYVAVVYTVASLANSTGFYDRSAPYEYCIGMPMAVGYSASQVNSSDFSPIVIPPCPLLQFAAVGVSVGGIDVMYIPFGPQTQTQTS